MQRKEAKEDIGSVWDKMRQKTITTEWYEHMWENREKRQGEENREATNAWGALPPLLGEETSVNEIDSFPTQPHSHPPPSVFDKHALIHTQAHVHTHKHTCISNSYQRWKESIDYKQTSEESSLLPGGSTIIGPDKHPKDNNNNKASTHTECSN